MLTLGPRELGVLFLSKLLAGSQGGDGGVGDGGGRGVGGDESPGAVLILGLLFSHSFVSDPSATPWTVACKAPLFTGFPRQEYWSELSFPPPSDLPNPRIEPPSPALAGRFLTTEPPGKPVIRAEGGLRPLCVLSARPAGVVSFCSLPSSGNPLREAGWALLQLRAHGWPLPVVPHHTPL